MEDSSRRPVEPTPRHPDPTPTGTGIDPHMAGALSYFLGALSGILFLVLDRDRPFVRFHAMQSIVLSVAWFGAWVVLSVLGVVLGAVPLIGWLVSMLLSLALGVLGFVLWLYLMFRAYSGDEWELPVVGEYARRFAAEV